MWPPEHYAVITQRQDERRAAAAARRATRGRRPRAGRVQHVGIAAGLRRLASWLEGRDTAPAGRYPSEGT